MTGVLVVESDRDVRGYLVLLLGALGHAAAGVGSAGALSRRAARRAPDAVLCDATLPDGSGIEACRRLKLLRPGLLVVIMAWDRSGSARARRAALGPILLKPFSPPELKNALTLPMLSIFNTRLSHAVSGLKTQNGRIRALIEDAKAAAAGEGEK